MSSDISMKRENGFSLVELLCTVVVFLPLIGAVVMLFGTGVEHYNVQQRVAQMNEEARNAVETMSLEVAQAGTRRDTTTSTKQAITGNAVAQSVQVAAANGLSVGDKIIVDGGASEETVQLTAVGTNSISGIFLKNHADSTSASPVSVRFFGLPYLTGVVPPAGLAANSSVTTNLLKFYGDFYDDGILYYIEYAYDSANSQITKSITALTEASKSAPQVLVRNVTAAAAGPFTLYSDGQGAVTLVKADLTVQSTWQNKPQSSRISARLAAPGVAAASSIAAGDKVYGPVYVLPATPATVVGWSSP